MRYDSIVAGQIVPVTDIYLPEKEIVHYCPSFAEITLFISAVGVLGLIYILGTRILQLEEENHE